MIEHKDYGFHVFFVEEENHYGLSSAFATDYTLLKNSLQRTELQNKTKKKVRVCLNTLPELQMELGGNCKKLQSPYNLCVLSRTLLVGLCFIAKGITAQKGTNIGLQKPQYITCFVWFKYEEQK